MADGINTKTGVENRGYDRNKTYKDILLSPTKEQVLEIKESLIVPLTESEQATIDLKAKQPEMIDTIDIILDYLINGTPIPQQVEDKFIARNALRTKI